MIKTACAKFRKQNHPNNKPLLYTWAAFLSHFDFRPIYMLHDLQFCQLRVRGNITLLESACPGTDCSPGGCRSSKIRHPASALPEGSSVIARSREKGKKLSPARSTDLYRQHQGAFRHFFGRSAGGGTNGLTS